MSKTENTENVTLPLVNGVQVLPLALSDLVNLLDDDRCQKWLFNVVRPGDLSGVCPLCSEPLPPGRLNRYQTLKKTKCPACGKQFHATTNTIFHRMNLSPSELVVLAALLEADVKHSVIADAIGRGSDTVQAWAAKLNGRKVRDI